MSGVYGLGLGPERKQVSDFTVAQAHFASIAWQLVKTGRTDRLDLQQWPSIRTWTQQPVSEALPATPYNAAALS